MIHATAIYENGILKPTEPLNLTEGQPVRLRIDILPPLKPLRPRTPEEEEFDRRIKAAGSLEELFAVIDSTPSNESEFDVVETMNETRRQTGFRMPDAGS